MRDLSAGMEAAVAAQDGTIVYLFRIDTSGGSINLCTAPTNIAADVGQGIETWEGVGGHLAFPAIEETTDASGQGVELTLSGVDQSIIALVLNNNVRGREIRIWLLMLDESYQPISDPLPIFTGLQLSNYTIKESRSRNDSTCTVNTRVQSRLAAFRNPIPLRTNTVSHNDMLKRAGLPAGDTFFDTVPGIAGRNIPWGPFIIGTGTNGTGRTAKRRGG